MTPDAAGIIAQVNAGLLISLIVEGQVTNKKSSKPDKTSDESGESDKWAWLHAIGILSVFLSLTMTILSVAFNKPLQGSAQHVAIDAMSIGFAPLVFSALDRLAPRVTGFRKNAALVIICIIGLIWFFAWSASFIPGGFFW